MTLAFHNPIEQPNLPNVSHGETGTKHNETLTPYVNPFQGTWAWSVTKDVSLDYNSNVILMVDSSQFVRCYLMNC